MAIKIDQLKLHELFADPSELYKQMVAQKGYVPRQQTEFDAELIAPGWIALECVVLVVMVHHERRAYVTMLSSEDLTGLRDALEHLQVNLNATTLISSSGRMPFGTGLPAEHFKHSK
jgi:hypothetical protein